MPEVCVYYKYVKYRLYFQNDCVKLNLIGTASLSYEFYQHWKNTASSGGYEKL